MKFPRETSHRAERQPEDCSDKCCTATQNENSVITCAHALLEQYGERAEQKARRQISWSRAREAEREVAFWTAVLERPVEWPLPVSRIHVLPDEHKRQGP